jgi:hypothetical protein
MKTMKKFGFAAIVASGLTAGILDVASPIQAIANAESMPVAELPGYSTGEDHNERISAIHPGVSVPHVDTSVQQSR